MKIQVHDYRRHPEADRMIEYIDPERKKEIEIADDVFATVVREGIFFYASDTPSTAPEDGFIIPDDFRDCIAHPIAIHRTEPVATPHGLAYILTATFLIISETPFLVNTRVAATDENWGSDHPTYVEDQIAAMPIQNLPDALKGLFV